MAAAKEYKKAPIAIATEVSEKLQDNPMFESVIACPPGFLNLILAPVYVTGYVNAMAEDDRKGVDKVAEPKTVIVDYGGPNVAKPLHVGHLRSAVIGESVKRIGKFMGDNMIGDVHLGDWGLQMGLIITELRLRQPDLCYFDRIIQESIRANLHLRSASWKKSIRPPVQSQKKMLLTKRKP